MARSEAEAGSLRHSVCGQRSDRAKPYSTDFDKFSQHYADKVTKLKAAVKEMQEAVAARADFWGPAARVKDRMEGFLKCAEVDRTRFPDENIAIQIIDAPGSGYLPIARWSAAHLLGEMLKTGEASIQGWKDGCMLDGNKLEFVVGVNDNERRASTLGGTTRADAINYMFSPDGCMADTQGSELRSKTTIVHPGIPASKIRSVIYLPDGMPNIMDLCFDAVRDSYAEHWEQPIAPGGLAKLLEEAQTVAAAEEA